MSNRSDGTGPLARTTSMSSCAGYHTPIEDEVAGEGVSDLPSDLGSRGGSFLNAQVVVAISLSHFFSGAFLKIIILILIQQHRRYPAGSFTKFCHNDCVAFVGCIFGAESFIVQFTARI